MRFRFALPAILYCGLIIRGFTQAVSVNTPLPWVSLRNDTITVRAQIDTSALKKKEITITLLTVNKGKSKLIADKTFKITDPSGEFSFGKIKKGLIGGEEYLQIKWAVKGTEEKGAVEPIGIADLTPFTNTDTVRSIRVADDIALKDVVTAAGDKLMQTNKAAYSIAWNKKALYVILKKFSSKDTIKFSLDGKTGKNAFLSYPDRFINLFFSDTVIIRAIRYKREIRKDSLVYTPEEWRNEITHEVVGDKLIVCVPWYDTGMIPFEERTIGFAVFVTDEKGKTVQSLPTNAQIFIPATWGILFLHK